VTPVNETRPRKLAVKRTGSYDVLLVERDETYYLAVRYTGQWASGDWIEVTPKIDQWVDERAKEGSWKEADGLARKWFSERVRGDFDVRALLESDGYDEFGNRRARR